MENTPGSISTTLSGYGPDEVVSQAATDAHQVVDKATTSANETVAAIAPTIARVAAAAHDTVDKVSDMATPAVAWIERRRDILATKSRDAAVDAKAYVVAHPWQSLATAFAIGCLVGHRRMRR